MPDLDSILQGLEAVFAAQDGDLWFHESQALSTQAIVKLVRGDLKADRSWRRGLIPFARDVDDNLLVADAESDGAVYEWDSSSGLGSKIAPSFSVYLEHYRDQLLSGHHEFIEEMGIVEKMGSSGK
jgi:hypothetical protein